MGHPEVAYLTIARRDGSLERLRARGRTAGSFYSQRVLRAGESAFLAAGDVQDAFGNVNGADSRTVRGRNG